VWWQGLSMAKAGQAEQRLERILAWKGSVAMHFKKSIALVVVALAVPVVYIAASAHPAPRKNASLTQNQATQNQAEQAQAQQAEPAPPAPVSAPNSRPSVPTSAPETSPLPPPAAGVEPPLAPSMIHGTITGGISAIPIPSIAPVGSGVAGGVIAPSTPVPPAGPFPPTSTWANSHWQDSPPSSTHGFSYAYGFDDEQRFVIVSGKTDSLTMSGSAEDARHAEKLRKTIPGDFIWFQRDEKSYVIRDSATIDRARKLWAPQEELGKQQEALGKQQAELGARMEKVRVNVPDMTAELDKLRAEMKQLSSGSATAEQIGHIQSEIGELQSKIGEVQSHAGDQQGKLGEEMGALGEKQGKLGEQQGELGRKQGELAREASRQMKQLLDEAITKGTAQPEI
jgi:peptidoglycan hydrolase CwlO-like protein